MDQLLAIRVFVRIVEANSFTKSADQLGLPRSTVSKLLLDLEHHLGTRLVDRTTRRIVPTQEGLDYYDTVTRILSELDHADSALKARRLKPSGPLRIEATSSFANLVLIPRLSEFREIYPDIQVALGISDRTVDLIGEGVDCAIRAGDLPDTTMISRKLFDYESVTFASRDYLGRMGTPSHPDELRNSHHLVGYFSAATGKPLPLRFQKNDATLAIEGFSVSANESTGHVALVRSGLGIGQNLRQIIQPYLDSGELLTILEDWTRPPVPYHLVFPGSRARNARVRAFLDWSVLQFSSAP